MKNLCHAIPRYFLYYSSTGVFSIRILFRTWLWNPNASHELYHVVGQHFCQYPDLNPGKTQPPPIEKWLAIQHAIERY
jgi:hypothetical protein